MTKTLTAAALLAISLHSGYGQTSASAPAFEVASITPCKPGTPEPPLEHAGIADFTAPGGRFTARATTLKFLLEWAYGIQPAQHQGGPSWLGVDRYDVVAKAAGNPSDEEMKRMVQTLLAERFQLQLHHERNEISAYLLSRGKAEPRLSTPQAGETHGLRMAPHTGSDHSAAAFHVIATRYTLAQLADTLARQLGSVIVNRTGLNGEYDFTLDLAPDETRPNPLDPALLLDALREQLGLTVKYKKTPVDVLVIDSAEKVAAGN